MPESTSTLTLTEVNAYLERKLHLFRATTSFQRAQELAPSLDKILYTAIEEHAPNVNAIRLRINPAYDRDDQGFMQAAHWIRSHPSIANRKEEGVVEMVMNLPYHVLGDHPRMYDNVHFLPGSPKFPGILQVNLGEIGSSFHEVYLCAEQILGVELTQVQNHEFTDLLETHDGRTRIALPRDAEDHYTRFYGFYELQEGRQEDSGSPFHDDITRLRPRIRIHDTNSCGTLAEPVFSGFVVYKDGDVALYEFANIQIPPQLLDYPGHVEMKVAAYLIAEAQKGAVSHTKYSGNHIITRLHEFKGMSDHQP